LKKAIIPSNEKERIEALRKYEVLDTLPEMDFDDFTKIASNICQTPIALISLVDESRQWFKSKHGLDAPETPRDIAFCSHAILQDDVFVVEDSFKDERFHDNPLATGAPDVRFYAGAPLNTPAGFKIGTLCVIDDKPRNISPEQISALEALARQVINQLELRLSKKKVEKSLEAKEMFFANMSHEIRTPLNGIIGFTELLIDQQLPKESKDIVKYINECSKSLLMIVNDILDVSKIDAGKLGLENISFNLNLTIEKAVSIVKTQLDEKGLTLEVELSKNVPPVITGDPLRVRQILLNLIGNSIKFTNKGSISIKVDAQDVDGVLTVTFEVKDTGVGIPSDSINKIFNSFEQVDSSTTRNFGGTGLGLTICSKLVKLMKGSLSVSSEEGIGSTFQFSITSSVGELPQKNETVEIKKEVRSNKLNLNILVAEDNKLNQVLIKSILNKMGYEKIMIVPNGLEAVKEAQLQQYDLILMDVQMPIMDGYQATRLIREGKFGKSRIVGLSANCFAEDIEKSKKIGMNDYLEKPINLSKLSKIIDSIGQDSY
jgi:signal transduction histidine kinase/ActR/RegA family two-component response regulator